MRYKTLGKTGLKVSEFCLGTWGIGGAGWDDYPKETRLDAIKAAIENGINFIDTAPAYNGGAAEQIIGEAIEELGCRDKVIICTKCSNDFVNGQYVRNGSYDNIIRLCERSLKNLRTDYVDILLVHWPDPNTPFEETFRAINELKAQGKVKHVGVSNFNKEQILEAEKYCEIEVFQPHYSMIVKENEELIKWAYNRGIGIMAYGALGGGILTGAYRELKTYDTMDSRNRFYKHFQEPMFSKVQNFLKVMDDLSSKRDNVPLAQITLNWTTSQPFVSCAVVGCQSRKKIEQNVAAFNWNLTEEEMNTINDAIQKELV